MFHCVSLAFNLLRIFIVQRPEKYNYAYNSFLIIVNAEKQYGMGTLVPLLIKL